MLWCPDTVTQHLAAPWQDVIALAGLMLGSLNSPGQPELQGSPQVSEAQGTVLDPLCWPTLSTGQ